MYTMLKRKVHTSVVEDRIMLEYGLGRHSVYRHNQRLLKKLVCNPNREFKEVCHLSSSAGDILYQCGNLYKHNTLDKTVECFSLFGDGKNNLKKLYSFPSKPRWYDLEVWQANTTQVPLKNQGHRASLFYITYDRYLVRRDLYTGAFLEDVYLSPVYKFVEILLDEEAGRLVLKSTRNNKVLANQNDGSNDILMAMAVFVFPHLEFQALFEITKSIFGKTVVDSVIHQGILLTLHSDSMVKVYSLEYILAKFTTISVKLGETYDYNGRKYVLGRPSMGLVKNVFITETPPLLMGIKTVGHQLQIGGHPWHYICHPANGKYMICDLETQKPIKNGILEQLDQIDPEQVMFHPDDTSKVIHLSSSQVLIYKILNTEDGPLLDEWFTYDAKYSQTVTDPDEEQKSSFGRRLTRPRNSYFSCISSAHDLTFSYENELDLLGIFTASDSGSAETMMLEEVLIYDNLSGQLIRKVPIERNLPSMTTYLAHISLNFDGPLLIAKVKQHHTTCFLAYQLTENIVETVESSVKSTSAAQKKRRKSTTGHQK